VLVALGVAGWMWWNGRSSDDTADKAPKELSTKQVNDVTNKAIASGKYDDAVKQLKEQPESLNTQLSLAVIYMNKKDYKSAFAIYDELDRKGALTIGYISGVASFAELAKDYQKALYYYKKAKQLTEQQKNTIPTWQDDLTTYNAAIKRLQQKL